MGDITKVSLLALSSDGEHKLCGRVYLPSGEVKGYFQVVHGMTEHIERYDRFMTDMAENGYLTFGYDHLGHGKTAINDSELGFIADKNGWELLARDVKVFFDAVKAKYPHCGVPYYLMGHSMGSFIVRVSAERFVKPDKLIIMGTGGPNPAAGAGLALIAIIKLFRGKKHFSRLIDGIAFGSYNKRFGGGSEADPKPWLTNDESVRKKYYADKLCTFNFSVSAMGDLITLIKLSNSGKWFKSVPDVEMLLVSGEDDPVGDYGNGVRAVEKRLLEQGKRVKCILYKGARHEILNDFTYEDVRNDIIVFCENNN